MKNFEIIAIANIEITDVDAYRKYEKYNLSVPDMNLLLKKLLVRTRIVPKFKFPPELNCTTTRSVQFFRAIDIPEERTSNSSRIAILAALENDQMWTWRHERTEGKTTYVGLKVRSHYIQAAIIQNQGEIITILCDSKNVRQRKTSIHRNVKKWKEDLDKRIHSQLLKAPDERSRSEPNISDEVLQLLRLHKKGIVTDAELEMLLRRLVSPDQSPAP